MPDLVLDLRYLKYAVLVAEHGSFRRAAEASNIPQSTISRRIQMLEARVGAVLFKRSKTGTRLTRAGEHFISNAAVGAYHLRQVVSGLASMKLDPAGQLKVGVTASLAQGPLANLLKVYRTRFPEVRVAVQEAASESNATAVANGLLDVAFVLGSQCAPGCERITIYTEGMFAAVPAEHPLAFSSGVSWDDLRDEVFIIAGDCHGPEVEGIVIRQLSKIGFRPQVSIQNVGRENLLNMVGKGFGVTVVAASTLGATYPGVQFLPFFQDTERLIWSATWSSANGNSALASLLDLAHELAPVV